MAFEFAVIDALSERVPLMKAMQSHSQLDVAFVMGPNSISLLHRLDVQYLNQNKSKHKGSLQIDGLHVKSKYGEKQFSIQTIEDVIVNILIEEDFFNISSDFYVINAQGFSIRNLKIENPDKDKLLKILDGIDEASINKIETEDTIEIVLGNKKYYTIIDMEDGNYVGVDKKGVVYRLLHDSNQQAKLIDTSVSTFLSAFSGDKNELAMYFEN